MVNRIIFRTVLAALVTAWMFVPAAHAQAPTHGPEAAFLGCEDIVLPEAGGPDGTARDMIRERAGDHEINSGARTRILQGQPLDAVPDAGANLACWARLDGVWREMMSVGHDDSLNPATWAGGSPAMASLAHGTYTTPQYLIIEQSDAMDREINLFDGLDPAQRARFVSDDGVALKDVLKRGGPRKTYKAASNNTIGKTLDVSVTRSGFIRLQIDRRSFQRPSPGVSSAAMADQYSMDEIFLIQYNLENLVASRRGYDITKQDAFRVLNNDKAEVFQEVME